MSNAIRSFFRFVLLFVVSVFGAIAFAAVPLQQEFLAYRDTVNENPNGWSTSQDKAVDVWCSVGAPVYFSSYDVRSCVRTSTGFKAVLWDRDYQRETTATDGLFFKTRNSCPANSSQSGSSCSCNSGFDEKNGQCVKPDACGGIAAYCSGVKGGVAMFEKQGQVDMSAGSCLKAPDFQTCSQGCATSAVGMGVQYKNNAGQWVSAQELKLTGGTCAVPPESDQPTQKDSDCAGAVGEVNGVKKCIPSDASKGDTKEKTTDKADGSKETVKTETKCENGVCETTKTTTKTNADGSTSTETSKTAQDQNSYCSKNPTSAVCAAANGGKNPGSGGSGSGSGSGTGSGSGNGNGSGNCTGDKCEGNGNGSGNGSTTVEVPDIEVKKLYERKYPKGIASAWSQSGIEKASEKFSSLASVFAPPWYDQKGQCQRFTLSMNVGIFNWGQFDLSPDCSLWIFLWVCMQIGAVLLFRALVFGG